MENIIKTEQLTVGYNRRVLLKDLSFSIKRNKITVILGKSGCGKSTVLKALVGLLLPQSGNIDVLGESLDYQSEISLHAWFRKIGVLFQSSALLNSLTLYENIALPLRIHFSTIPKDIEKEMTFARLTQVGLQDAATKYPGELSGGMRKRAGLARALILDPLIVFCDEPTAGLDPITASSLDQLLLSLKSSFGITVVVVTHELRSIAAIADQAIVIHDERIYYQGTYQDLCQLQDSFIKSFFLEEKP
jgi:phospholipid/cholesterol/gamma-HCH transport system ATP-binding protein